MSFSSSGAPAGELAVSRDARGNYRRFDHAVRDEHLIDPATSAGDLALMVMRTASTQQRSVLPCILSSTRTITVIALNNDMRLRVELRKLVRFHFKLRQNCVRLFCLQASPFLRRTTTR